MSPADRRCGGAEVSYAPFSRSDWTPEVVGVLDLERGGRVDRHAARGLLRVVSGLCAVSLTLRDGRRQILCLNAPDDIICPICSGECWIEALAPTRLELLGGNLTATHAVDEMRAIFELTHERLAHANMRLTMLGRLDGAERVAAFLSDISARIGRRIGDGATFVLPMSRDDIADYLGLNSETVSRIFTRMKRAGLVRFPSRNEYLVPDVAALAARAPISVSHSRRLAAEESAP